MLPVITDHVARALARLRQQYKNKPKLAGLITAFVDQIQDLEYAFNDLNISRTLGASTGIQLDLLGTIIGLERNSGEGDEPYRLRLQGRVVQNISQGEPELVIQVLRILTGSDLIVYHELYPAALEMAGDGMFGDQTNVNTLFRQVKLVLPAGVRCDLLASFSSGNDFSFADTNEGVGFGDDLDSSVGGAFAELLNNQNDVFAFDGSDPNAGGFGDNADPLVGGLFL